MTHSHDNEIEGKRLLEWKIDERKHKKDGLVGNKAGRKDQKRKKKMKYKRKRKKKKKKKKKRKKKKKKKKKEERNRGRGGRRNVKQFWRQ